MNSTTVKILGFLVSIFILINVGSQLYSVLYNPYTYETAVKYTLEDTLDFTAIFVRDEELVEYEGKGVISYRYPDGSKVSAGSVIAEAYSSAEDIRKQETLSMLSEKVGILKASQEPSSTDATQLDTVNKQITETYSQLTTQLENEDFISAAKTKDNLLTLFNRMNIITGKSSGYDTQIDNLEAQMLSLSPLSENAATPIKTDNSGFFVGYYDGYEDKLIPSMVDSITISDFNNIVDNYQTQENSNTIGKIVKDYNWKLVGTVELGLETSFFEGAKVNLKIGANSSTIPATVDTVKLFPEDGKSLIILSCDRIQYDLVSQRIDDIRLYLDTYTGIIVPSSAVRYNDASEKGVYIKLGQTIFFRKINVLYDGSDFKIVEDTGKKGYLAMYDEIVVEGKDLYDSKPVK